MTDWQPIVTGTDAERIDVVIDDIAATLAEITPDRPGLDDGAAGLALFFASYGEHTGDERAYARATALIERASAMIDENRIGASWSAGIAGIGWSIEYLAGDPDGDDDPNRAIDHVLERFLDDWNGKYDLINGLAGVAVYGLARLPRPSARPILEGIVAQLARTAESHGALRTWHTSPAWLPEWQRELTPHGHYNLGLAHGVPALIAVLAKIVAAGIATEVARPLLDGAIAWQLEKRMDHPASCYASWLADASREGNPARTAWCYGDPGVASALLVAARQIGNPVWEAHAVDLMHGVVRRIEQLDFAEAGICHGALGVALVLARFFHATQDATFQRAARTLVERALRMRRPGTAVAGFPAYNATSGMHEADAGFLTGAAGVGLALLSMIASAEPGWDQVLLLA